VPIFIAQRCAKRLPNLTKLWYLEQINIDYPLFTHLLHCIYLNKVLPFYRFLGKNRFRHKDSTFNNISDIKKALCLIPYGHAYPLCLLFYATSAPQGREFVYFLKANVTYATVIYILRQTVHFMPLSADGGGTLNGTVSDVTFGSQILNNVISFVTKQPQNVKLIHVSTDISSLLLPLLRTHVLGQRSMFVLRTTRN